MKSFIIITIFATVTIFSFCCNENPVAYNAKETGLIGQVYAINTGGPTIPGGIVYHGICKIALLDTSHLVISEFVSDSLGKFKLLSVPGIYYLQVNTPKLSDATGPDTVTKNQFTQVIAIYDKKLK
jgi:hypothetical protein